MKYTILFLLYSFGLLGQSKINSSNTCQFNKPDTSVYNISLNNEPSVVKRLGNKVELAVHPTGLPCVAYCTEDGKQELILFHQSGGGKNDFSEVEISYSKNSNNNAPKLKISTFLSGNGIKLGLSKGQVIAIMGKCYKSFNKETIKYVLDDFNHSVFLQRFNLPVYYAYYEFKDDKLIRFKFGFEEP